MQDGQPLKSQPRGDFAMRRTANSLLTISSAALLVSLAPLPLAPGGTARAQATTNPTTAEFDRLFGGLNAAVAASSVPTQAGAPGLGAPRIVPPGYSSGGAGVLPNGGVNAPGVTPGTVAPGPTSPSGAQGYSSWGAGVLPNAGINAPGVTPGTAVPSNLGLSPNPAGTAVLSRPGLFPNPAGTAVRSTFLTPRPGGTTIGPAPRGAR
jgi:hypothetical protein